MFELIFAIGLQAPSPQPATLSTVSEESTPVETAATEASAPPRKRVCRTVLDTRTGLIAKPRKVCRFVEAGEDGAN